MNIKTICSTLPIVLASSVQAATPVPILEYQFDDATDLAAARVRNHYFKTYTGGIAGSFTTPTGVIGKALYSGF